jgi:gamma-glutamyltranspeptidase/glutathione hydrolase
MTVVRAKHQHPSLTQFGSVVLLSLCCVIGYGAAAEPPSQPVILQSSAVAVSDKFGADAAEQVFKQGGNAVDAAVAIAFTLAVTYPEAGNIGGGGFMTLYVGGKPYFLDYRERAPLAAKRDVFLDKNGAVIEDASLIGPRAAAVPGTVAGLWKAQHRFGKLTWAQVLSPAIHFARDGFKVSDQLVARRDDAQREFAGTTNFDRYFGHFATGDTFKQPELAATLQRIARHGAREFYTGKTAALFAAEMRKQGGLITQRDLAQYKAVWRQPIDQAWNGYHLITAPPPSSGGIALLQLLKMRADLQPAFKGEALNSAQYMHLTAEIEKRVFADRAQYLGDPDFYKVPLADLTDDAYLAKRASEVNLTAPSDTQSVLPGLGTAMPEKTETTHFSVVDRWGNAVSNTYTINGYFGSGVVVGGAGFVLNDEMDDFSAKPGVPNMFGVVGADANAIAPGKRPLSSMTPTILTRNGKVALVIGTPGGSRIFTSVYQVISNLYDFKMPLHDAVAYPRFHHQLLPENTLFVEPYAPLEGELSTQLEAKGYNIRKQGFSGDIQAIEIEGDRPEAMSDPRGRGVARIIN